MKRAQIWVLVMGVFFLGILAGGYLQIQRALAPDVAAEAAAPAGPLEEYQKDDKPTIETAAAMRTSVVAIRTMRRVARQPGRDRWDRGGLEERSGLGSGVIAERKKGTDTYYILTNSHVVARAETLTVELFDGRSFRAFLVGADPNTDIAVVRVQITGTAPRLAPLGNSDKLRVGQTVLAIGTPNGWRGTVTKGIISATGRTNEQVALLPSFLQTDAAINPGNSGGPLVDLNGQVIGINTWISSKSGGSQGLGFSVPVNHAHKVMTMLIRDGRVTRAYIGILRGRPLTKADMERLKLDSQDGVRIAKVVPDSPATRAKLQPDDVIIVVNGKPVPDFHRLLNLVAFLQPGSKVTLKVIRDGKSIEVTVTLATFPKE